MVEAFAAGVPVVGSRLGAIPTIVEQEVTGMLAAPGRSDEWLSAVSRLLDDGESCEEARGKGDPRCAARLSAAAYTSVAKGLQGRPLILRTLDVGADKPLPYLPQRHEANPFLGVRGIRLALEQPELLETQLRAVLRTAAEYPLKVMFPMVATLEEYRRAKGVLADVRAGLERADSPIPEELEVGVMIEVPAAALAAEQFAPEVDFFSLGTNDLTQYTLAAERGNAAVAGLADGLHPSVLRLIRTVAEAANGHGKWAGVCGELASDPAAVPVLVGLGIAELSANAPAIPAVKQAVRGVDADAARDLAEHALELSSAAEVRELFTDEAAGQAVVSSRSPAS